MKCIQYKHDKVNTKTTHSVNIFQKTNLSEETKDILKELFAQGMDSKGITSSALHNKAVERTGLPLQVIKDWIGNYKKVVEGRKYEAQPRTLYLKGMTGYNCFVREKKDQFNDIADWAPAWNLLGQEEKEEYKQKAKEKPVVPPQPQQKDAFKRLKIIREHIVELEKHSVDVALVGIDTNTGSQILLGDGKSAAFLKSEDILQNLFAFHSLGTKEVPKDLKSLQQEAQTHMNKLYSKAVGKKQAFPYTKVKKGNIQVNGIPLDVLPLVPMSNYGEKKMKMILNIKEISVEVPTSPEYEVLSLPVDNAIETELNMKVQKAVEEDNLIEPGSEELLYNLLVTPEFEENIYSLASPAVTHILPSQPVTHALTSPPVTHTLTSPPVTHTLPSLPVTQTQPNKTTVKKSLKNPSAKQTFTLKKKTAKQTLTLKKTPVTHTLTSTQVTHTLPSPPVTQTLPSPPVTHTFTSPPVTQTLPSPPVTHTRTSSPVTYTVPSPPITHTVPSPPITHTVQSPPVTLALTSPPVTLALTSPPVTHIVPSPPVTHIVPSPPVTHIVPSPPVTQTVPSPPVTHTLPSPPVTHTLTSPPVTHTLTSPPVTLALTSPPVTHTVPSPPVTHTVSSPPVTHTVPSPPVTHTVPSPPVTHTLTSPPVTHTLTSPPVTHTLTSPPVTLALTSPPVTNTLTSPPVTLALTSLPVTHTLTSPPVTLALTSPPVTHTLTSPPVTLALTSAPVTHTSKRPRGTAANRTKATKKRKNNKEWGVKGIIATRNVGNSREYLIHWDGFNHDHDSWEPEFNLTPSLIGQFFSNKI
ncbi:mucin-17-like [Mytilus trossulus]|uniref:mucin-17-like n=1 Tax=Mytilus trossulus TaxID=6551 RepID=UPI003005E65A